LGITTGTWDRNPRKGERKSRLSVTRVHLSQKKVRKLGKKKGRGLTRSLMHIPEDAGPSPYTNLEEEKTCTARSRTGEKIDVRLYGGSKTEQ